MYSSSDKKINCLNFPEDSRVAQCFTEMNWSNTSSGAIESWSSSFKMMVNIILNSKLPMFITWGAEQTFIYNDAYISILEPRKYPWAFGRPFADVWSENWSILEPMVEHVLTKKMATLVEDLLLVIKRDDSAEETYFTLSYSPIQELDGSITGLLGTCIETTERIINERRLKILSELSVKVFAEKTSELACKFVANVLTKNLRDIPFSLLYLLDDTGKYAVFRESTGLDNDNPLCSPDLIDLDNENKASRFWPLREVIEKSKPQLVSVTDFQQLLPVGLADQNIKEAFVCPLILLGQEKPVGILIAGVNPCRKLDEKYLNFYEIIAKQVSLAIQNSLTYQQEIKQVEMLAEVDRAKTAFFAELSHEFRTPLTLILGSLDDSLNRAEEPLSFRHHRNLELIQQYSMRLEKMVSALLDFSRIEANRIDAICQPIDINKLTSDLINMFSSVFEKGGLKLIVDFDFIDEYVYLDKGMWEKIIFNLLSNAFKFTLKGSVKASLKKESKNIVLTVEDTGIGIPNSEFPFLFKRFHRIPNAKGRSYEGCGIGLALTFELVKLHGGSINVRSQEGEGSQFSVTIPLGYAHLPANKIRKTTEQQPSRQIGRAFISEAIGWLSECENKKSMNIEGIELAPVSPKNKGIKILFADDNYDMRELVKKILESFWEVEAVADGEIALQSILAHPPDLALIDTMMPNMDGLTLLKILRSNPKTQAIPTILCSARAGEEERIKGYEYGTDDYIVKPFLAKELIARVEARLKISQLRKAAFQREQDILTEVQLAKSKCIADLFHEIRNPLNGIWGGASLLQDVLQNVYSTINPLTENISPSGKEKIENLFKEIECQVEMIIDCAKQQKIVVDEALDLAKLESNKVELNPVIVNPKLIVNKVIKMFEAKIKERKLQTIINIAAEVDQLVQADEHRFSQILINLLSNAIKFTHEGSISISATIEIYSDTKMGLRIIVADTGIGMSPESLQRIFKPFSQATRQTSVEYGGSGLGLLICKRLVEAMGGKLKVNSTKGKGSCFTFTIDCLKPDANQLEQEKKKEALVSQPAVSLGKLKGVNILIVEDNIVNQKYLGKVLEQLECNYQIATNGVQAIEKWKTNKFDLIFMDIIMPVMGGLDATEKIRKEEKSGSHIPIVGLTGNALPEQKNAALAVGMDAYIPKPYTKQDIYNVITDYIGSKSKIGFFEGKKKKVRAKLYSEVVAQSPPL